MVGERSRTINGWFNGFFEVSQNAVGIADITNLELKNRERLCKHPDITKICVIARDNILIIELFFGLVIPKQSFEAIHFFVLFS
jgi:hypothetical protein